MSVTKILACLKLSTEPARNFVDLSTPFQTADKKKDKTYTPKVRVIREREYTTRARARKAPDATVRDPKRIRSSPEAASPPLIPLFPVPIESLFATPCPGEGPSITPCPGEGPSITPCPGAGPSITPCQGEAPSVTPFHGEGPSTAKQVRHLSPVWLSLVCTPGQQKLAAAIRAFVSFVPTL